MTFLKNMHEFLNKKRMKSNRQEKRITSDQLKEELEREGYRFQHSFHIQHIQSFDESKMRETHIHSMNQNQGDI